MVNVGAYSALTLSAFPASFDGYNTWKLMFTLETSFNWTAFFASYALPQLDGSFWSSLKVKFVYSVLKISGSIVAVHLKHIADTIMASKDVKLQGMWIACYCRNRGVISLTAFTDVRKTMFSNAESQLKGAQILRGHRYQRRGSVIINELLKKGSISSDTYYGLVGPDTGDKLLGTNVFAFHFNSREISFQSTLMKRFCEENSALWRGSLFNSLFASLSGPGKGKWIRGEITILRTEYCCNGGQLHCARKIRLSGRKMN